MDKEKFYITTPIYYPNGTPHMGHAYTTLLCDAVARYHRLMGHDVYFLTGTDENTEKVVQAAEKIGENPDEYLLKIIDSFKGLYGDLEISYDQFIRTSDQDVHWPGVIEMWKRLEAKGDLYKGSYTGLYCVGCEAFLTEKDLVDGKCPNHNAEPKVLEEENYFFKLSAYTEKLAELIRNNEIQITPETRRGEILSFIEQGLEDISFSRPAKEIPWGVPVPGDDSQRMYVWMDALSNYITGLGFGRGEENMKFWPGTHVIGKDILRFHAAIWPAMLLSADLPMPKEILVHGMIISGGKKMSKSLGNGIDPRELLEKYGPDATRYLLLRHVNVTEDTDITWDRLDEWYQAHLVNGYGNLVSRVMKLAETHLEQSIEQPQVAEFPSEYTESLDRLDVNTALDYVWKRIGDLDEKISETEPFKVVKTDLEKGREIIAELATELYLITRMLNPFMPETNKTVKGTILANKKPENLFPRLN